MKEVISFSLWGDNPKYTIGALKNIECRDYYLPNWICRFYVHTSVPDDIIKEIKNKNNCEIIEKTEQPSKQKMDNPGMFWRFEVLNESDIDRFIIRDTDSRITDRDVSCILDWERTNKPFHIIRDHRFHNTKIMGGMWGATNEFIRRINYNKLLKKFKNLNYTNLYATDQEFLARMIYPLIKNEAYIHDNWDRFREGAHKIPHFSTKNQFVGQPFDENNNPL
ncbi:MAG: hypothetical protein ACOC1O_00770 [bacterium]